MHIWDEFSFGVRLICIISVIFYAIHMSGTSLLRSPTGLGKTDLNEDVTLFQRVICTVEYNLGLIHGDGNGEVFLLVR